MRDLERGFGKGNVIEHNGVSRDGAGGLGEIVSAKRIKPRHVDWLWRGYIAFGGLVFLTGDAGVGKGLFLADLVARLSRGRKLPDGARARRIPVLIYSKEENLETTLVPRLKAAGADLNRVKFARPARTNNGTRPAQLMPLPEGIQHVSRFISTNGARLIIFDPIFQFLARGTDTNNETAVFDALQPLIELAQEMNLAVLCVRHPNKKTDVSGIYRMMGSAAFGQIPRTIVGIKQMPGDEHGRMLVCEKNNLMAKPPALGFIIGEGRGHVARIEWRGPLDREAEEAAAEAEGVTQTKLAQACEYLKTSLSRGKADASVVARGARDLGISDKTRERARKKLNVQSEPYFDEKSRKLKGQWLWLPGKEEP